MAAEAGSGIDGFVAAEIKAAAPLLVARPKH
jgi:hypothetical protein